VSVRLFLVLLVALAVVATAVGVVDARQQHRLAYIDLSRLEQQRDELNIEFSRLQLEQATWSETNRIEQVATERLGMKFPEGADMVVISP
jgi:cell division protein FtsL